MARVRKPAAESSEAKASGSSRTARGTWKSEPAEARTVLGLYGSTDSPAKSTAVEPEASAARSTVPALPGSRTSTRTTISEPGRADHTSAPVGGSSSMGSTASTGWGVTVSATRSSTPAPSGKTRAPAASARRQTSWVARS